MSKNILAIAGLSGAFCVAAGAMGAHALKHILPMESMQTFETGVKYQFYHTLALCFISILIERSPSKYLNYSASLLITGIILFSGSLYFLALRPLMGIGTEDMKWLGAITPFGGISFILAWLFISIHSIKKLK